MQESTRHRRASAGCLARLGLALTLAGGAAMTTPAHAEPSIYEVLHHFEAAPQASSEGSLPPVLGRDGKLYGLKEQFLGNAMDGGSSIRHWTCVLYRFDPAGGGYDTLATVDASGGGLPVSPDAGWGSPCSAPVETDNGDWYWNTFHGGAGKGGQLLRYRPGQGVETVFSFPAPGGEALVGSHPQSVLVQAADGTLYGTTARGGQHGYGTVFAFTPGQGVRVLHALERVAGEEFGDIRLGGQLTLSEDGSALLGVFNNEAGSVTNAGDTFFSLDRASGVMTRLVRSAARSSVPTFYREPGGNDLVFAHASVPGVGPTFNRYVAAERRLVQTSTVLPINDPGGGSGPLGLAAGGDGNLYGAFVIGGSNPSANGRTGTGSLFRLKADGSYEVIHMLAAADADGKMPEGASPTGVVRGADGRLYGVADLGGEHGQGVLFALTPGDRIAPGMTFRLVASGAPNSTVLNFPDPHTIVAGQWAKFRWASIQADECEGGGDWPNPGPIAGSGELEVTLNEPREYRYVVSCRNTADPTQRFTDTQYITVLSKSGTHTDAGNGGAGGLAVPLLALLAALGVAGRRPRRPSPPAARTH